MGQVNRHAIRDSESKKDEGKVKLVNISKGHTIVFNTDGFILSKNKPVFQVLLKDLFLPIVQGSLTIRT